MPALVLVNSGKTRASQSSGSSLEPPDRFVSEGGRTIRTGLAHYFSEPRNDSDLVVLHGKKSVFSFCGDLLAGAGRNPNVSRSEHAEGGLVSGKDTDLSLGGLRDDHLCFARPHLCSGGDHGDVQVRHD